MEGSSTAHIRLDQKILNEKLAPQLIAHPPPRQEMQLDIAGSKTLQWIASKLLLKKHIII